jgi:hypothetical protein
VVDRERLLVAAASGPHLAHGLTAPELELESDTTSYEPNYGKASALHALCTACSARASSLPGGKSNEEIDRLHSRRHHGHDHGNYRLRQQR